MDTRPPASRTVLILTGPGTSPGTIEIIEAIRVAFPQWRLHIVQHAPRRRWGAYLMRKLRRLAREPISYPLELLEQGWRGIQERRRGRVAGRVRMPAAYAELVHDKVTYASCPRLDDPELIAALRARRPWLAIALSAPLLPAVLFELPERGTINVHKSLLPAYRGMPPGFWELHDGAATTGVTVHRVTKKLDAGAILEQRALAIPPYATPAGLAAQLDELAVDVLIDALRRLDAGDDRGTPQPIHDASPRRRPTWLVRLAVERKCRARSGRPPVLRALVKQAVLAAYVYGWAPVRSAWRRVRGRCHVTVLLYHRVSDTYRDGVTVGVEQFARQLRTLRRHYDVLDLPTWLATRGQPRFRPAVVITFDDGYADNALAARLLRRAGLPATFFIATRIVGAARAFAHDMQKLGRGVPTLTWKQVRAMAAWGFQFGNHTAEHVNLARVAHAEALRQIEQAQCDLYARLDRAAVAAVLAYPFGRAEDITPAVRAALPGMGIAACLAAHGGVNGPTFDAYDVCRRAVDHKFSVLALRAAVEGWRVGGAGARPALTVAAGPAARWGDDDTATGTAHKNGVASVDAQDTCDARVRMATVADSRPPRS
jgi:hypothetical protein